MRCASSTRAVTVDMNGVTGLEKLTPSSAGRRMSAAPSTSGLWKAPLTRSFTVLRAPRADASSMSLSTAAFSPETTTWPGQL